MDLNSIVFPAPKLSWDYREKFGELLWIPAKKANVDQKSFNKRLNEKAERVRKYLLREYIQAPW